MRKVLAAVLAVGTLAAVSTTLSTTSAEAWGGCGPNRHPTPFGCRWNGGYYGGPVVGFGYGYGWHRGYGWRRWHRW